MKKGKALMNVALNIKNIAKIPAFIKTALDSFLQEFNDMKDAVTELKNNIEKIGQEALKCIQSGMQKPPECYKLSYGPITYTPEERTEWEKKMEEKSHREGGQHFNPNDYPKTDMITADPKAKK
jgi:hypothetical protein